MLRESIKADGQSIDLEGLADPDCAEIAGLAHSRELIEFSDAFISRDPQRLAEARDGLERAMGNDCLVDAAGVASNFQRMVRIADGTGIPVDPGRLEPRLDLVEQLDLAKYESAKNTLNQ